MARLVQLTKIHPKHQSDDGPVAINPDLVVACMSWANGTGTMVEMVGGTAFRVKEDYETVLTMLTEERENGRA